MPGLHTPDRAVFPLAQDWRRRVHRRHPQARGDAPKMDLPSPAIQPPWQTCLSPRMTEMQLLSVALSVGLYSAGTTVPTDDYHCTFKSIVAQHGAAGRIHRHWLPTQVCGSGGRMMRSTECWRGGRTQFNKCACSATWREALTSVCAYTGAHAAAGR